MWKNKEFKFWLIFFLIWGSLILITFFIPFWYDDTGHSLVVYQLYKTGLWAFPKEYPHLMDFEMHSTMVTGGPALHYPASWLTSILGWNFYTLRLMMAFLNGFYPLIIYKFSKKFFHFKSHFFAIFLGVLNVQFLVYGSQYLGEVIMTQWILWGIYFQFLVLFQNQSNFYIFFSQICFYLAILTKEYIALPLGLYMFFGWIYWSILYKKWCNPIFFQGITLPIASLFFYYFHFQNFTEFLNYWNQKKDYQEEFLNFSWDSILFILKKPLITLGGVAIVIKIFIKRKSKDVFLAFLQFLLLFFFVISKGFDRLGFVLIPISALYLSEWIQFLGNFLFKSLFQKVTLGMVCLLLFSQNVINPLYWYHQWKKNEDLKILASKIETSKISPFFTYELEIIPYLKNISVKTTSIPPVSSKKINTKIKEKYFLVGEYAKTEYDNTWSRKDYEKIWEYEGYEMWKLKTIKEI